MAEQFARWLDVTLANRELKNTDVADIIGVSHTSVSKWRSGGRGVPPRYLGKLAHMIEVDPVSLLVTAGVVDEEDVGVGPLPMPTPDAERTSVKRRLAGMGLAKDTLGRMLTAYDRSTRPISVGSRAERLRGALADLPDMTESVTNLLVQHFEEAVRAMEDDEGAA